MSLFNSLTRVLYANVPMLKERDRMNVDERKVSRASQQKSVAEEPITSVLAGSEVPDGGRALTADEEVLVALGYK